MSNEGLSENKSISNTDDLMGGEIKSEAEQRFLLSRQQRQKEQEGRVNKRSQELIDSTDPNESVDAFWSDLTNASNNLLTSLDELTSPAKSYVTAAQRQKGREALDILQASVQSLELSVSQAASIFLPSAECKRASGLIQTLFSQIEKAREIICPREKFTFGYYREFLAREKLTKENLPKNKQLSDPNLEQNFVFDNTKCTYFENREDEVLSLENESATKPFSSNKICLRNLKRCVILVHPSFGSVKANDLLDCTVICSPVAGSIYIERCQGCKFVLASRQLRIHETQNTSFVVHVLSGPIIEDCKGIVFSDHYIDALSQSGWDRVQELMKKANLEGSPNKYHSVKDFKWHNVMLQSPNWSILSSEDSNKLLSQIIHAAT